jgi:diguanylate cyclase (GGDEF)-like protein/PAS domain S-box-containing protein
MTTSFASAPDQVDTGAAGKSLRRGVPVSLLRHWLQDRGGLLIAVLAVAVLLYLTWLASLQFGGPGREHTELVGDTLIWLLSAVAAGLAWRAGGSQIRDVRSRRAWRILALAYGSLSLGNLLWLYFRTVLDIQPYPSLADVGYLSLYPLLLWALLSFPVAPATRAERTRIWLDTSVVVLGAAMVLWHFVIRPVALAEHTEVLEAALSLAYPVLDLVLVFGTATLMLRRTVGGGRTALGCLAAGLFFNAVANLVYGYQLTAGTFASGGWPDALWAVATLLIALSGQLEVWRSRRVVAAAPPVATIARLSPLPYIAVATGYGLLVWVARDELDDALGGLIIGAVALTCLVVARQVAAHRENARLLQEQTKRRSEARFRSLVQHASDLTTIVSPDSRIYYQSPSVERVAGHRPELLVKTLLTDLVHPDDAPRLLAFLDEVARHSWGRTHLDWRLGRREGGWLDVETTATNLLDDPDVEGIVLNTRDVTERKALEGQLRHQAFHDPLTDLANRALFRDRVEHALTRADRRSEVLAVLYLDLDNFKTVNDSFGHPVGDALLVEIAARFHTTVRAGDTVARLGGDEFAILLEDATGEHTPELVAGRLAEALLTPVTVGSHQVLVSASIGIADATHVRDVVDGADELLRNADVAMYAAKGHGKGCAERFKPEMYAAIRERLELTASMRRALELGEFRVFYQPIVELRSGLVQEVEALVRWQHPDLGLVPPVEFIPLAEETGLIVPLGRWVLEEACRQASAWQAQYPSQSPLVMSVNLSGRQFADPGLVADVAGALRAAHLQPKALKLEITESIAMQDAAGAEATMRALKALGVKIAIDDFGTGYSSLQYLKRFPVDTLKIDRSFVNGLGMDEQDTAIVQSVVALAKTLHLDVTGEGIETPTQESQLRRLGVERGQGYLFARPLPAEEVGPLLGQYHGDHGSARAA